MICPNCGRDTDAPDQDDPCRDEYGHASGCFLSMCLTTLADRGHDVDDIDFTNVDVDALWEGYGGPAVDFVAEQLGLDA